MATKNWIFGALLVLLSTCYASYEKVENIEEEGYYKREHSLAQPYHGRVFFQGAISLASCFMYESQVMGWMFLSGHLGEAL